MKKAVLYCRVAVCDHDKIKLNKQEQTLRKFAASQNYEIVETVKETCGGKTLDRPGLNKIYEIANAGEVDAVIAENISRYGRCSISKMIAFIESLRESGVKVIAVENGDLQNILSILKSFA